MKMSPALFIFSVTFVTMLGIGGTFHLHGFKGYFASATGAALIVLLTRRWWKRAFEPLKRPPESFRDPSLGSRAKRRADQRRHKSAK